jgi:uracil-DNA glycosylase
MYDLIFLQESFNSLDSDWQDILIANCADDLIAIDQKLQNVALSSIIYPPQNLVFNALKHTKFSAIKVVILGQDPYHGEHEANGLAFAVNEGVPKPPSLRNIYTELVTEYGNLVTKYATKTRKPSDCANCLPNNLLVSWADQGVLLLNSSLTVVKDQPNSLAHIGWSHVTDKLISVISNELQNVVFVLWGNFAKSKIRLIDQSRHLVLTAPHPSPLSAYKGFFGCNHFMLINQYLTEYNKSAINWLPD